MMDKSMGGTMWPAIDKILNRRPKAQVTAFAFILVALFGICDHLIGPEFSFLLFYLIPVAIASWYAGKDAGISVALAASAAALLAALGTTPYSNHYLIVLWAVVSRFGAFLVIATLLDILHDRLALEQKLARIDSLTGSLNRHAFMEQLQYNLDLAAREKLPFTLAYIDVDNFKKVNDTCGHNRGDQVLISIARILRQFSRRTDLVSRLGGDEFAMLFPNTAQDGAQRIISKARKSLEAVFLADKPTVSCSIGVVTFLSAPAAATEAVKAADLLMYEVKNAGKNSIAFRTINPPNVPAPQRQPSIS